MCRQDVLNWSSGFVFYNLHRGHWPLLFVLPEHCRRSLSFAVSIMSSQTFEAYWHLTKSVFVPLLLRIICIVN